MAVEPASETTTHDFVAHERDYSGFIRIFKIGAVVSFVIAMLVLVIIS